jgi:gluconokinase
MPDGAILAIDVGTSSSRASLYDTQARAIRGRRVQVVHRVRTTADGGVELDPNELFDELCGALDRVLAHTGRQVLGVATDTFWHSLLGVDAVGRPLTPIFTWLDTRARAEAAELRRSLDERAVHARTGCALRASYWPARLRWLQRTRPDVCRQVDRWISFGELVLERMTGRRGVSVSMASGTGLLDTRRCAWDAELLDALDLEPARLGPIEPLAATSIASAQRATRWPALAGVPWQLAVGDGACSNLGAGCATPDRFAAMIGTSAAERAVGSARADLEIPSGTWCYRVDEQRVVVGGALNDGGNLFEWLKSTLRLPPLRAIDQAIAALPPDAHGLTVLPFWGGERSTGWADDARGSIVGLRFHTTPVEILRACMEAIALRLREIDRLLLEVLPVGREVVATGGALLRSRAWMQILADVLGRPVSASLELEASSRGASLLALETLGLLAAPLESLQPALGRTFEPRPERSEIYRAAAERQRRVYEALIG